jgi:type VI secretion system protein ImpE
MNPAEQSFRDGDLAACLAALQGDVRRSPADSKPRIFLAQVMMILGQWERALNQLNILAEMDASTLPMVRSYEAAIRCEAFRKEVFAGQRSPLLLGDPEPWIALLLQALALMADGHAAKAEDLRAQAFDAAATSAGTLNGKDFEWIADADPRLGPVLELILNGKYYWVPFTRFAKLEIEAPSDVRDLVWLPAQITFTNGGETVGLIPVRYPGSEQHSDDGVKLARKTLWQEIAADTAIAHGQRIIATDAEEVGLLDVRALALSAGAE